MQNDTKVVYSAGNADPTTKEATAKLTKYAEHLWEKLKMDFNNENVLKDGAISGDGFSYFWDDSKQEICIELIDSTNIFPSNPNADNIQADQDYIELSFRRSVESVRREAEYYKVSQDLIDNIVSDTETQYQAGDSAKIELDDNSMCIVLMKFWKDPKTNTIHCKKSTKTVNLFEDEDTLLERYPIAMFSWETVKNSFHGVSDVTE